MSWDFETPADVKERLDWAYEFVRAEVEPFDLLILEPRDRGNALRQELRVADFFIVMAVSDPGRPRHERMSLLLVPKQSPGLAVIRHVHVVGKDGGEDHSYLEFRGV